MSPLIDALHNNPGSFDFFRAVFLLERYFRKKETISEPLDSGKIRFRPDTSMTFPPSDITAATSSNDCVELILSFMGLLGASSPLPIYFSEYVSLHPDNADALTDFISVFNHRLYALFYRAWKKYRISLDTIASGNGTFVKILSFLSGTTFHATDDLRILAFCGILSGSARSAQGLEKLLSGYFSDVPVTIKEFVPRCIQLRNVASLGAAAPLGAATVCGTSAIDHTGKFRIVFGPLSREQYESFLPGGTTITEVKRIVSLYLSDPLDYDIELQLQPTALTPAILGDKNSSLGATVSLGVPDALQGTDSVLILPGQP